MDNVMLEKIKELLSKNETIGIAVGKNPGVDEMAGALSLYLALSGISEDKPRPKPYLIDIKR